MFRNTMINFVGISLALLGNMAWSAEPLGGTIISKKWRILVLDNNTVGGIAYAANKADALLIGVTCTEATRNILFINPDIEKYDGNRSMKNKAKSASESPILVFNEDFDNQYALGLFENASWGDGAYGFALGSTLKLPDGSVMKNLKALLTTKEMLQSNNSVWIGFENPETGNTVGRKISLSGSTGAINKVYKMGNCEH